MMKHRNPEKMFKKMNDRVFVIYTDILNVNNFKCFILYGNIMEQLNIYGISMETILLIWCLQSLAPLGTGWYVEVWCCLPWELL